MAIQDSIGFIKNKALNKIIHILESPSGACWQEETPEQARIANIESAIREMNREIEITKVKYKKKAEDAEQGVQADKQ